MTTKAVHMSRMRSKGRMRPYKYTHFKRPALDVLKWQGIGSAQQCTDLIRQGRVRFNNNQMIFDPNHGIWLKGGSKFTIDKMAFHFYPKLYVAFNKGDNVVCALNSQSSPKHLQIFPNQWFGRKKAYQFMPIFALPSNMSGLTIYSDDTEFNKHCLSLNLDLTPFIHTFIVSFYTHPPISTHTESSVDISNQSINDMQSYIGIESDEIKEKLFNGVTLPVSKIKVRKKSKIDTIDAQSSIDDNSDSTELSLDRQLSEIADEIHFEDLLKNQFYSQSDTEAVKSDDWSDERLSQSQSKPQKYKYSKVKIENMRQIDDNLWEIQTIQPRPLYRLLRAVGLRPMSVHRTAIGDLTLNGIENENEWQIMNGNEIAMFGQYSVPKITEISENETENCRNCSFLNDSVNHELI